VVTSSLDLGNYPPQMGGGPVAPPVLVGMQSLWVGADFDQASALCWVAAPRQQLAPARDLSPIAYDGTGTVNLLTY
jgi:hypothetical protein